MISLVEIIASYNSSIQGNCTIFWFNVLILLKSKKNKADEFRIEELLRFMKCLKDLLKSSFNSENMFEMIHMFRGGLLGIKYSED